MNISPSRTPAGAAAATGQPAAPPPVADPATVARSGIGRVIGEIAPAVVLAIGMVAAVNVAIPRLQASGLHPSVSATAWVVDSYTLVFACLLIPAGALGDRFGRKRGMLAGLGIFAIGSAMAGLAPSVGVLMVGRALSGVGAAFVLPATLAVSLARVAPPSRPQAVALWSALSGIAGVLGNLGGGLAVQFGGWRTLFWAGVPIALGCAALIAARVPDLPPHEDPVDGGGALLLTAGSVSLLYGVIQGPQDGWGSAQVIGSLVAGGLLFFAFTLYELRQRHPMLDPRLFRLSGVRAGALGIVALFFMLFGFFYINAQYLQDVKGFSPLEAGVCILPIAVSMLVTSVRSTHVVARIGSRATIVLGLLTLVVGVVALSCATVGTPYWLYGLLIVLTGAGCGLAMPPLSGMIVHSLPPSHAGVSSGLNSTTREFGSAFGVAVLSTLLTTRFTSHLPHALRVVPGARGSAIRHSITAALADAQHSPHSAALAHASREAFISGTSLGLRVGAALLVFTTAVVIHQHPRPAVTDRSDAGVERLVSEAPPVGLS